MNIQDISDSIDKLKLDKETRDAIIKLIDAKINNDMNTFSEELKQTKESLQNQNSQTEKSLENKISGIEKTLENKIDSIKWFLAIMIAISLAILAKSFI